MRRNGITLVEMLVAMAITLVMMAAVVTVFANVSSGIQNRRAAVELGNQIRHVRGVLQRDLEGATCPALTWQRPESNHGYLEIIEGPYSDSNPSLLTDGIDRADIHNHDLDEDLSIVPRYGDGLGNKGPYDGTLVQRVDPNDSMSRPVTTLNGLGDYDDILALTVRNEEEPFTGNVPSNVRDQTSTQLFANWGATVVESPLAEVVWFAVENPHDDEDPTNFFGEPGMRTIYRRTLLIAPWIAPYRYIDPTTGAISDTFRDPETDDMIRTEPGVVRVLPDGLDNNPGSEVDVNFALAALIAFQERYDLSVRLEWDPRLGSDGRWKIVANTLADLTKRENRYEHHYYYVSNPPNFSGSQPTRLFPYGMVSTGGGYSGNQVVTFIVDSELQQPGTAAQAVVIPFADPDDDYLIDEFYNTNNLDDFVAHYKVTLPGGTYASRPFAFIGNPTSSHTPATVRAILNDEGQVAHCVRGLAPLSGQRRGEDVMLTDALAFDIRVYDPGAPIFQEPSSQTVLQPGDPAWAAAFWTDMEEGTGRIGDNNPSGITFVGQGAFVDLGYGLVGYRPTSSRVQIAAPLLPDPVYHPSISAIPSWFFRPRWIPDRFDRALVPGYSVYDTWSFHYEHNGIDEDNDGLIDEGTNAFDDDDTGGVDDISERETTPPYDRPLRGIQVRLRGFERDSRQIREVTVNQHFVRE